MIPHPVPDADTAPFWEYCRAGELRLQRCSACRTYRHHPRPRCPSCRSGTFEWSPCRGSGTVFTYTLCHRPVLAAFDARVPYNVVVVRLSEGPFMVSNLVGTDQVPFIGMPVEVTFTRIDDQLTLPQFRPA